MARYAVPINRYRIAVYELQKMEDIMEYTRLFECNNGFTIMLSADSRNTRNGFAHDAKITVYPNNGTFCGYSVSAHCYYLNRTWEKYTYQTVLQQACHNAMECRADELKAQFLQEKGYKRLTKKRAAEFMETLKADNEYSAISEVLQQL